MAKKEIIDSTTLPPKIFNDEGSINDFLRTQEAHVCYVINRCESNNANYVNFDKDYAELLEKLPNSIMKRHVSALFNQKLIFYGSTKNNSGSVFSRVFITKNDKIAGVLHNSFALDIDELTGHIKSNDTLYATYHGLIRAVTVIFKQEILKDTNLHQYVTMFLYTLFLKLLGRSLSVESDQKKLLHLLVIYLYHKQFLEQKHSAIIKKINKNYTEFFSKEEFDRFQIFLDRLISFDGFKDFSKIVSLMNLSTYSSSQIMMYLLNLVGPNGFHAIIGSLDYLIAMIIISRYPTDFFSHSLFFGTQIKEHIETIMEKYLNRIQFDDFILRRAKKK